MQWFQPGKKLLFMGGELATRQEWNHDANLDWSLHDVPMHAGIRGVLAELNELYHAEPALHRGDADADGNGIGMQWIESHDAQQSVFAFLRTDPSGESRPVLVVLNATPAPHHNYRLGVPVAGRWTELFNSDATQFGGSGVGNYGGVTTTPIDAHGQHQSIVLTLPPLGALALAPDDDPVASRP
jgi:1,4-alpha-glucan branching enzyme